MSPSSITLVEPASLTPAAAPVSGRRRLGDILCSRGLVSRDVLRASLDQQGELPVRVGELLRCDAGVKEADILAALAEQWRCRQVDPVRDPPDPDLIEALGLDHCLRARCMPWRRVGAATVIATVHPDRVWKMRDAYERQFGQIMVALVTEAALTDALADALPVDTRRRTECRVAEDRSSRCWETGKRRQWAVFAALSALIVLIATPVSTLLVLTAVALLSLVVLTALKIAALIAAHTASPADPPANVHPLTATRPPVISVLVPLYREAKMIGRLLERLDRLDYPRPLFDLCLVIEADDRVTRDTLADMDLPPYARVITVPCGSVRTKPRALNFALDHCRGSIVGIYDAEDAPEPGQLRMIADRFAVAPTDVACLQGRLSFYNPRDNWLSRCFTIDYAIWFGMVLPGLARLGVPIPLGGTTLFFRRDVLDRLGAWDAHNVTEDADLGIRLAREGFRTELIDTTTHEEANARLWPWIRQRSRWLKGYVITYATHMRQPGRLWRDIGPLGFVGFQILFLAALLQTALAPLLWLWWLMVLGAAHPLAGILPAPTLIGITLFLVAAEGVNIALAVMALRRTGQRWLLPWILTLNPYFMVATVAMAKGLIELIARPFFWDKTEHGISAGPAEMSEPLPTTRPA